uniref:VCRL1 variant J-2 n=1 Tax=Ciona intestinalis TaxID=7719 RepID=I3NN99_CIOIN|nr:vCRL1 variant J-2 [Ciona intestinalis]
MCLIKGCCYILFQLTVLLLHSQHVNAQAFFTFSALSLQPPISSVGSTATATCNVTYTGSTASALTWKINDVSVLTYRIENGKVPQRGTPPASGYDISSSTTTSIVNTSDTFPMSLEIRNLSLTLNLANVSLSCSVPGCITQVNLQIKVCQPSTGSGVIATVSSAPCGFGCTVQYSCASGYNGNNVTATCQADATFDAIPICATDTTAMTTDAIIASNTSTPSTIRNDSNGGSTKTAAPLSNGAIAGIVIGCIIVVAIIIVVLIAIFCAEICCCTFSILCLSWGTKQPDPEPDITIPELKKNTQPDGPNGDGDAP